MRRHLFTAVTLIGLTVLVVWAAMWGWRSLVSNFPGNPLKTGQTQTACKVVHVKRGGTIRADQVQVSVYNSGSRFGLAGSTLDSLMQRGFIGGEVGNAPARVHVPRAQVWTTQARDPLARLVALQFGAGHIRIVKKDLGPGVDVVVGDGLKGLLRAPLRITAPKAVDLCVPVPGRGAVGG